MTIQVTDDYQEERKTIKYKVPYTHMISNYYEVILKVSIIRQKMLTNALVNIEYLTY